MDLNLLRRMAGIETKQPESISSSNSTANEFRRLAGLSSLPVKEEDDNEKDQQEKISMDAEQKSNLPEIISSLVKQAEGKSGSELEDIMMQIYDAGKADARAEDLEKEEQEEQEQESEEQEEESEEQEEESEEQEEQEQEEESEEQEEQEQEEESEEQEEPEEQEEQEEKRETGGVKEENKINFSLLKFASGLYHK